jgi:hypothetical protein
MRKQRDSRSFISSPIDQNVWIGKSGSGRGYTAKYKL